MLPDVPLTDGTVTLLPWRSEHADNVASQRVAERAGFRRERVEPAGRVVKGQTWDIVRYGLERPAG